jgi:hypothetical protein
VVSESQAVLVGFAIARGLHDIAERIPRRTICSYGLHGNLYQ